MVQSAEVIPINIEDEMRGSYLDYAMSVIIGRAIPDVRDGFKPVHRRILYAMYREGLLANKRFSKCAGVVGEVLKKYHPHGDSAVYDTLVRLAQDWNMRYPLIEGQGNFGCFTGDTEVRLTDGTTRSFVQLVKDAKQGITHCTYTIAADGSIAMAPIRAPRRTKCQTPIVRVTLDTGAQIRATPDHRFLLRDGTYCEAKDLLVGQSLMPLYSRLNEGDDPNLRGYEEIYNPPTNEWVFAHRLADAFNIHQGVYPRSAGRVRHHKDFNKLNNDPRNIVRMHWADHRRVHQDHLKTLWADAAFRRKMKTILARLWKDPKFREKTIRAIGRENRRRWADPIFREKQWKVQLRLWKNPAFRERILNAAMEKNVLLYGTEEQKSAITKAQRAWLAAMWKDPQYVATQRCRMRARSRKMWSDPQHREAMATLARERWQDLEYRARISSSSAQRWQDPSYRTFHSERSATQWKDPTYREKHAMHIRHNGIKTTQSRFLSICQRVLKKSGRLTVQRYDRERSASGVKGIVRFEQGLQRFFHGNRRKLRAACLAHQDHLNHTVVGVESAGRADVYDITIDDTHNFALAAGVFVHNSIDGDAAAAYRYTEARLTKLAEFLLADIDKDTVDFIPNFDASTTEPVVLPSRVPNLILNGSDGIAVGMATKIPPHNLTEIVNALLALIKQPDMTTKALMKFVPGPDFPTGAFIHGRDGIQSAYNTGRGIIRMRARAAIEPIAKGDREQIIVNEIPFQVNKARLIERIADLVQAGKIEGISDIRDESDRDGMRIVVELKRGAIAGVILNQLYKHTAMEGSFGVIMLTIVNRQPKITGLKGVLQQFLDHRREVIVRRTAFELRQAQARAHLLEGLKIAVENIDAVIALIKKAKSPEIARHGLMSTFALSEIQAQAVLDMRLQRLTGLERQKIIDEYTAVLKLIETLQGILADERLVYGIITDELQEIKDLFGDERRTEIMARTEDLTAEDLIQEEDMVVTISHRAHIKRNPISLYRAQRRGGQGKKGMTTSDEDFVEYLFVTSTHHYLLIISSSGRLYWLKVHEIPQIGRTAKGRSITNLIQMPSTDHVAAILPVREFDKGGYVMMCTANGIVKKTELSQYSRPRAGGIIALKIDDGDQVIAAQLTSGEQDILLSTRGGQAIRFAENEARAVGRVSRGVRGVRLQKDDLVVSMETLQAQATVFTMTANGYGKRTALEEYRRQSRAGSGIITIKTTKRNGHVVAALQVNDTDDIMLVSSRGKIIRTKAGDISVQGRNTQGVRIVSLAADEYVASVAKLAESEA